MPSREQRGFARSHCCARSTSSCEERIACWLLQGRSHVFLSTLSAHYAYSVLATQAERPWQGGWTVEPGLLCRHPSRFRRSTKGLDVRQRSAVKFSSDLNRQTGRYQWQICIFFARRAASSSTAGFTLTTQVRVSLLSCRSSSHARGADRSTKCECVTDSLRLWFRIKNRPNSLAMSNQESAMPRTLIAPKGDKS